MATIVIRRMHPTVKAGVVAYAKENDLALDAAALELIDVGLRSREARRRGAAAVNAGTKAERSASAKRAAQARWSKKTT